VVGAVCVGAFMGQLDASIVTVALPRIGQELHAPVGAVEWVSLAYLLVLLATVASVGHLADAVGRKLLYLYGFVVFTTGSLVCALATGLPLLIGARVLQGLGAALLQANSVALVAEAMPRRSLGRGLGLQGTAQALGLGLGPALGGLLLAVAGWRLIFLVNVPAGAIGLVLGWLLLPRRQSPRTPHGGDPAGATLLAISVGGPLAYVSLAGHAGYANPALLAALGSGLLGAALFVRHEQRVRSPMVDLALLRRPGLAIGLGGALISYLVLFATLFVVPYYLAAHRVSSASAGLQLAVLPGLIATVAPFAGRMVDRLGERALTTGGLALAASGLAVTAGARGQVGLLVGLAMVGGGLGAFTPANNAGTMTSAPTGRTGVVSGLLNMTRGLGTAVGVALAGALYAGAVAATSATAHTTPSAASHGLAVVFAVLAALAGSMVFALFLGRANRPCVATETARTTCSLPRANPEQDLL
jgi:EmrB/QacA subfamily drug resistance transporter